MDFSAVRTIEFNLLVTIAQKNYMPIIVLYTDGMSSSQKEPFAFMSLRAITHIVLSCLHQNQQYIAEYVFKVHVCVTMGPGAGEKEKVAVHVSSRDGTTPLLHVLQTDRRASV